MVGIVLACGLKKATIENDLTCFFFFFKKIKGLDLLTRNSAKKKKKKKTNIKKSILGVGRYDS